MVNMEQFTFLSSDGTTELHARLWHSGESAPRAVVQIAHGVSEHISRYEPFARYLAEHGFAVAGHDHLGHGDSLPRGGTPIYFAAEKGWEKVTDDVHTLTTLLRRRFPGVPLFLLGHSMGSFLTRSLLIRYPGAVDGAIVMGTGWNGPSLIAAGLAVTAIVGALQGKRSTSALVTNMAFGSYNKPFAPNRTDFDWISSTPASVDRYIADPQCGQDATVGLFHDMLTGFRFNQNRENLQNMCPDTPIFFIAGGDDPVGAMGRGVEQTAAAFRQAGVKDVTVTLYPGLRHEILNEACAQETVWPDLLSWLEGHI